MRQLFAIASLAIRAAIRSRFVISLIFLLLLTILGLPLTIKGDGTLEGQVRILLNYSLGLATIILGIAILWAACGMVAEDIEGKQIHLVVVKPVHFFNIWLGKWIGLTVLAGFLIALTGLVTYGQLHRTLRKIGTPEEQHILEETILVGRRRLLPHPLSVDDEVSAQIRRMEASGGIPSNITREELYRELKKRFLAARSVVAPQQSKLWTFEIPDPLTVRGEPSLRFRLSSPYRDRTPVSGTWRIGVPGQPPAFETAVSLYPDGSHLLSFPAGIIQPGKPLQIMFENAAQEESNTVIFSTEQGMELLFRETSFETNLIWALLIILGQMALLAAFGITAGIAFSFPVASFAATALVLVSIMSHYFVTNTDTDADSHHHGPKPVPSLVDRACEKMADAVAATTGPVLSPRPLSLMSDGILLTGKDMNKALFFLFLVYPGVFALMGTGILCRRELALPD